MGNILQVLTIETLIMLFLRLRGVQAPDDRRDLLRLLSGIYERQKAI